MDISQIDTLFTALLANPRCSSADLASFIRQYYYGICQRYAKAHIKKHFPALTVPDLVAQEAAERVVESQETKVLSGSFTFKGNSLYSTYLYTAIKWQIPKVYRRYVFKIDPARMGQLSGNILDGELGHDTTPALAFRAALMESLQDCLALLEPQEAELLTLVLVRGLTPAAACRSLALRSPSYTWKKVLVKFKRLAEGADLGGLYALYNQHRE